VRYRHQPLPAAARDPAAATVTSRYQPLPGTQPPLPLLAASTAAAECHYALVAAAAAAHSDMPCTVIIIMHCQ
jgi:hypothetical protein